MLEYVAKVAAVGRMSDDVHGVEESARELLATMDGALISDVIPRYRSLLCDMVSGTRDEVGNASSSDHKI